ncbi:hypothetical protein J3458_005839 [Metarhizium acridum]|uniref:uncharacterized protein n=1 Tax=Metarhizium acridum TaxID=92637 RepID=UPI001C6AE3E1|nr:hypothetical protein J3458_005839 [Metarhizium acridum]
MDPRLRFIPWRLSCLLELGKPIRLIDSTTLKSPRYVALSHCWGRLGEGEKFCTTKHNLEDLEHSVDVLRLPRNFRDAITVTLGIGLKYLWIDSLCIVQDDKDDWNSESVEMENIYSSAYCTIAASSAKSSFHGFLTHREPRECVQLPIPGGDTLYTCPNIDDFDADVELGELNQRGWVLQGRALSRRTIFSSTQVYWQCSDGVRCETLTRPKCHMASFLADANFPKFALQYYRDGRQMSIQDLFERYSRQAFTDKPDRGGSDPRSAKPTFQSPQD